MNRAARPVRSTFLICLLIHGISFLSATLLTLPLTTGTGVSFTGSTTSFGISVAKAGDINGDSVHDLIIGDSSTSTVYVVFGSTGLSDLTSTDLTNLAANSQGFVILGYSGSNLGISVSFAGDVNGDSIDDIIIGAPQYSSGSSGGAAYIIFGKTSGWSDLNLNTAAGLSSSSTGFMITGPSGSSLGCAVSSAGDVNGDSIDDVVIGAYAEGGLMDGAAYVIYGKTSGLVDVTFTSGQDIAATGMGFKIIGGSISCLGYSVSGAGDVNGDNVDDIIVGATVYNGGQGYAAVIFGSSTISFTDITVYPGSGLASNRGFTINAGVSSQLGNSVSGGGDVNGDGFDDIMIGAYNYAASGFSNAGAAFVIYGSPTISDIDLGSTLTLSSSSVGFRITGAAANSKMGQFVSNAEDFNADGIDDILVVSLGEAVYLIYGSSTVISDIDQLTRNCDPDSNLLFCYFLWRYQWRYETGYSLSISHY